MMCEVCVWLRVVDFIATYNQSIHSDCSHDSAMWGCDTQCIVMDVLWSCWWWCCNGHFVNINRLDGLCKVENLQPYQYGFGFHVS